MMKTIGYGFSGPEQTDFAWTDFNGAEGQYLDLHTEDGIYALHTYLARHGVEDFELILCSQEADGFYYRVAVPDEVA